MIYKLLLLLLTAVILAACGDDTWTSQPTTVTGTGGIVARATDSTFYANNTAATLAAEVARQTAVSADATQQVQEWLQGTADTAQAQAQGTAVVIQATEYAISSQSTVEALAGVSTANAAVFNATGTIVASQAAAVATSQAAWAEAQVRMVDEEAERLELANRAEEASITRSYILLGGLLLIALVVVGTFAYLRIYNARQSATPVVFGDTILVNDILNGWMNASPRLAAPPSRPLLPAPFPSDQVPLPPMTKGHILIAGETNSGKSTAARAALQRRPNVVVLDPHYKPGNWGNVKVIGAGRDFDSIAAFMDQMRDLLTKRYAALARGRDDFKPITVAVDEMPAIITALGREVGDAWREWLREGRKVGLFFLAMTQSTRVKTLGIEGEGDLLENFAYVLMLGKYAAGKYPDLVAGQERPAIIQTLAGVRPVSIPFIEPSGGGEVVTLRPNGQQPESSYDSLMRQYRDLIEAAYWQHIRETGAEPSKRFLEESVIGYRGGQAFRVVSEVLEQIQAGPPREITEAQHEELMDF